MGKKPDLNPIGTIKLSDLPKAIATASNGTATASYFQLHNAAMNGSIPAHRSMTGARWYVKEQDLPKIIETFSLLKERPHGKEIPQVQKATPSAKGRSRRHGSRG